MNKEEIAFSARASSASCMRDGLKKGIQKMGTLYDLRTVTIDNVIYYPFVFSKTLEHDSSTGFVKKDDMDKVINVIADGKAENRVEIVQHPMAKRQLVSVNDGLSTTMRGGDPLSFEVNDGYLTVSSKGNVFEMMEVYEHALLRDVPFSVIDEGENEDVKRAIRTMNAYGGAITGPMKDGSVTSKTLFRGKGRDECVGPYVSQFLYLPYNYGNQYIEQKYYPETDAVESVTKQGWLDIQNGVTVSSNNKTGVPKYNYNPRVLGAKVHMDPLYQFYYAAALIALQNGIKPDSWQTVEDKMEAFAVTGPPDIFASVADVAGLALRAAFKVKWWDALKIRPEVMAQRIDAIDRGEYDNMGFPDLDIFKANMEYGRETLDAVSVKNVMVNSEAAVDSKLLLLQFPEGSPVHPSWVAGHAVVAGACSTVLKAMFKTHDMTGGRLKWPVQLKHSVDGDDLVDYVSGDGVMCTVIGEFNKLASNVSIGRDWCGVHYRCDGDCGMKLGEKVAIEYLVDKCKEYYEGREGIFKGYMLEKFDGELIKITGDGVERVN
jgi:hypothetical protein